MVGIPPPGGDPALSAAEPQGFGDAVQAAVVMLAVMTVLAFVGFRWQRSREEAAHGFAIDLMERVARHGDHAIVPLWSGFGQGPGSADAKRTFRALQALGALVPDGAGRCRVASRFTLCRGTRYSCDVSAVTPAGPVRASIGLCRAAGVPYSFDSFDLALPAIGTDRGNRGAVDVGREGLIRYGTTPLPTEAPPVRLRRRPPAPWR